MKDHQILHAVHRVAKEAKRHKLSAAYFRKVNVDIRLITDFLKIPEEEAPFFSIVFILKYEQNEPVSLLDISLHLNADTFKMLEYKRNFDSLLSRGLIKETSERRGRKTGFLYKKFFVPDNVALSVIDGLEIAEEKSIVHKDIISLLEDMDATINEQVDDEADPRVYIPDIKTMLERHGHLGLLKKLAVMKPDDVEQILFLKLVWAGLNGEEEADLGRTLDDLISQRRAKILFMQKLMAGNSTLVKNKLVELDKCGFLNNSVIKLAEKSVKLLKEEGIEMFSFKNGNNNVVSPSAISPKVLYFNQNMTATLAPLRASLKSTNLKKIRQRLKKMDYPTGINVLFYGPPGTGKTELVYQLARETNREIIHVDISDTKSKWFGESEKLIKKVFTRYHDYLDRSKRAPILLFNEADAIIAQRRDAADSNTRMVENTVQNIILEELEKSRGLFFATTNFVNNLDTAFERRFLYKIEFPRPDEQTRAMIWKSKIGSLGKRECKTLANGYDFTGGQIDNIVRKFETSMIINGSRPDLATIRDFCDQERLDGGKRGIGFAVNSDQ